jgi:hypothetical protein
VFTRAFALQMRGPAEYLRGLIDRQWMCLAKAGAAGRDTGCS